MTRDRVAGVCHNDKCAGIQICMTYFAVELLGFSSALLDLQLSYSCRDQCSYYFICEVQFFFTNSFARLVSQKPHHKLVSLVIACCLLDCK